MKTLSVVWLVVCLFLVFGSLTGCRYDDSSSNPHEDDLRVDSEMKLPADQEIIMNLRIAEMNPQYAKEEGQDISEEDDLEMDTYAGENYPDENIGFYINTYAGHGAGGVGESIWSYYASYSCDSDCVGIKSADLNLYLDGNALTDDQTFYVSRVADAWGELTLTWNNKPATYGNTDATVINTGIAGWIAMNARTAVTESCIDGLPNNGLRLAPPASPAYSYVSFHATEFISGNYPTISYECWIDGDACNYALPLTVNTTVTGDTSDALADYTSDCGGHGPDLVYEFIGVAGTTYIVDMYGGKGTHSNTLVSVRGDCDDDQTETGCNDDNGQANWSQFEFTASPDQTTYYVIAGGAGGETGTFELTVCDGCMIDRVCYADQTDHPGSFCQKCDAATDQYGWSPKDDGTTCDQNDDFCDGEEECQSGACVSPGDPCDDGLWCNGEESCDEDGDECVSSGDPCDPATEECNEDTDSCDPAGDDDDTDDDDDDSDDDAVDDDDSEGDDDASSDDDSEGGGDDDPSTGSGQGDDDDSSGCCG